MMIIMYVAQLGKVHKVHSNDFKTSLESSASTEGVCSSCTSGLAAGFHQLKQQDFVLKKKILKLPHPKNPNCQHITVILMHKMNGCGGTSMGNYMFCHACIKKTLKS